MRILTSLMALIVGLVLISAGPANAADDGQAAQDGQDGEIVVLRTNYGDIVIALDWSTAPTTAAAISSYVADGYYDGTPFVRVMEDFVVQTGRVEVDREPTLTQPDLERVVGLPLEASVAGAHVRGAVTLARYDESNSGTSSFSILVADAPHLDTEYAVFGSVIDGMAVADLLNEVDTDDADAPLVAVRIDTALLTSRADLSGLNLVTEPTQELEEPVGVEPAAVEAMAFTESDDSDAAVVGALLAAMLFGIAAFLTAGSLEPRFVGALGMLAALSAGFGFLAATLPVSSPVAAVAIMAGVVAMLRLLSRFETGPSSVPSPAATGEQPG